MSEEPRPAWHLSTPMIKGELQELLSELAPGKRWPKNSKLKDLVEFTKRHFSETAEDPRQRRAVELANVIYGSERR